MYIMCVYDLLQTVCQLNVKYQSYADDTQIYMYIQCDRDDLSIKAAMHKLHQCFADQCLFMDDCK